jgi:hypothetical protein
VSISGIRSSGFDFAKLYEFKVCFGLFPFMRAVLCSKRGYRSELGRYGDGRVVHKDSKARMPMPNADWYCTRLASIRQKSSRVRRNVIPLPVSLDYNNSRPIVHAHLPLSDATTNTAVLRRRVSISSISSKTFVERKHGRTVTQQDSWRSVEHFCI